MAYIDNVIVSNATLAVGTTNSASVPNGGERTWVLLVRQGGGGTLTVQMRVSTDGSNWALVGTAHAITIGTIARFVYGLGSTDGPIIEPFMQIQAIVTGSSATGVFGELVGI
jgi:hypothetical protein